MSVLALTPPAISDMSRPTPTPATQPLHEKRSSHPGRKGIRRLTPALLSVPRISRKRATAKVPVTISHSAVSLGWWMVMSDDEQGYAPAAYLEPVEGLRKQHNVEQQRMETENSICEGGQSTLKSIIYVKVGKVP